MTINEIKELSETELQELINAANAEMGQRLVKQQKQLWAAVREAISNYEEKFGPISLEDTTGECLGHELLYISEMQNIAGTLYFY